jgi:hypothetical protein
MFGGEWSCLLVTGLPFFFPQGLRGIMTTIHSSGHSSGDGKHHPDTSKALGRSVSQIGDPTTSTSTATVWTVGPHGGEEEGP